MKNSELKIRLKYERKITDLQFELKETALKLQARDDHSRFEDMEKKIDEIQKTIYIATGAILLFGFILGMVLKFVKF